MAEIRKAKSSAHGCILIYRMNFSGEKLTDGGVGGDGDYGDSVSEVGPLAELPDRSLEHTHHSEPIVF